MKNSLILITIALILASCSEETTKNVVTNQTDPNGVRNVVASTTITPVLNTNLQEFQLRGTHARLIRTDQGTRIHVPSKAFVNKVTGDAVQGDVVLTFNEYHTQGEILASGIPMVYTTPEGDTVER